jgi:hypothetical protein
MSSVHHSSSSSPRGAFHLLAVFQWYTFRLTEGFGEHCSTRGSWMRSGWFSCHLPYGSSFPLLGGLTPLHAVLGCAPAGFHVTFHTDCHFRFSVASRHVGFLIHDLNRITTEHFDVYFHL